MVIHGFLEVVGVVQFLGNELLFLFLSDCDDGLLVPAEVVDEEAIPHTEFAECIVWATKKNKKPVNR